jgi:hypothetical protein
VPAAGRAAQPLVDLVTEGEDGPATPARHPTHREPALVLPPDGGPDVTPDVLGDLFPGVEPVAFGVIGWLVHGAVKPTADSATSRRMLSLGPAGAVARQFRAER